ncbi:uncharacterized protein LOC124887115 [Capsicum annuum]|uniref:uncharacterized protein LOC124887115 n=1 Tax=Capsicum annuum TaxID=4072 RepID=UPI001FB0C39F|nr:uncharacterized protein LOC124887115 [Capsicum annuum]
MEDFLKLKQGRMFVKEYALKFHQFSRFAPNLVADIRARMRKLSFGLNRDLILENKIALLNKDMDISRLTIHMLQVEDKKRKQMEFEDQQGSIDDFQADSGFRAQDSQSQDSGALSASSYLSCCFCGQMHHGVCDEGRNMFFNCGQLSHMQWECPSKVISGANKVLIATSSYPAPKGATSSTDTGQNCLYVFATL